MATIRTEASTVGKSRESPGLLSEIARIRTLVAGLDAEGPRGADLRLNAGVSFLPDGRVLCRDRQRGDSRYPYGSDGYTLWVSASGRMSASKGPFFWLLPTEDGQDPPVAAFAGCRPGGAERFRSHGLLPLPITAGEEDRVLARYTVIGHDATYFFAETSELLTVVRVLLDQDASHGETIHWSMAIQNLTDQPLAAYASFYLNPFCRRQLTATSEDRWFKRTELQEDPERWRSVTCPAVGRPDRAATSSVALPGFSIRTSEDIGRLRTAVNRSTVRRAIALEGAAPTTGDVETVNGQKFRFDHAHNVFLQHCTSWRQFVGGPRRALATAAFLGTGSLGDCETLTTFNENAIVGDLQQFVLPPGGCFRSEHAWSFDTGTGGDGVLSVGDADRAANRARDRVAASSQSRVSVHEGTLPGLRAEVFNRFVPYLQRQVAVCAQIRGYMQSSPNSLIGFRDILQAVEGRLVDDPAEARERILEALGYVLPDGRCPRQYLPAAAGRPALGDLREFVDQGAWAVAATLSYVRTTGDTAVLDEPVGYHQPRPGDDRALDPAELTDSVLDHLLAITEYLARRRDPETGLVCTLYGDWNDAIDGLGVADDGRAEFGSGVSVMASLQFYQSCEEMLELLSLSSRRGAEERLLDYQAQLRDSLLRHAVEAQGDARRVLHGWGDRRGFTVGGFHDVDGRARDGLTSSAFWVLSGMLDADPTLKGDLLAAFDRLDSPYGLKTFHPAFGDDAVAVGRIVRLPPGAAENGAVYIHATTFAIAALFRMGEPRRAWEQIVKILPFSPHHRDPSHSPFVMPNSYVDNEELNLTGQSMNDWQTGCSNVLWKTLVRYVFGFEPLADRMRVAPAGWAPFKSMTFQFNVRGRPVKLIYELGEVEQRRFEWRGSGELTLGRNTPMGVSFAEIDYEDLDRERVNEIRVIDPLSEASGREGGG